jgi:hypothetical protein
MLTRSNYESFFLDYHERNLSDALKAEVLAFLEQNPDLREEFEQFAAIKLEPEPVVFTEKSSLLKKPSVDARDTEQLIALHEGDLAATEVKKLQQRIEQEPALRKESELIARLRVEPDRSVVFPIRDSLKKGGRVVAFRTRVYQSMSIAAAILVLLLAYVYFRIEEQPMTADWQPAPVHSSSREEQVMPVERQQQPSTQFAGLPVDTSAKLEPVRQFKEKQQPAAVDPGTAYVQKAPVQRPVFEGSKQPLRDQTPEQQQRIQPQQSPVQEPVYAQQDPPAKADPVRPAGAVHGSESLADIFSDQELAELGLREQPAKDGQLWKIVEKGAQKLGEAAGSDVAVDRQSDPVTQSNTYALAIGKFSIRRSGR